MTSHRPPDVVRIRWAHMRWVLRTLPLALALTLVGCAGVPTNGPVEQVSPAVSQTQDGGVRIDAEAPRPGASPELIVAGFLNAMASLQPDFSVARSYLTAAGQRKWNPLSGTTIVDASTERITGTATSGYLSAPVVARLDDQGRYSVADSSLEIDLGLVKVDGEWRIDNPPEGLVITSRVFRSYYVPMQRYFLTADGAVVVPETLRVSSLSYSPTTALTSLLAGPSPWLRPAVLTALPASLRLADSSVIVSTEGVARVNFDASAASLDQVARQRVVMQVVWTLSQFAQINQVSFLVRNQPWQVPALLDAQGRISTSGALPGAPKTANAAQVYVVAGAKLGQVAPTGSAVAPVNDWRATLNLGGASGLAVSQSGDQVVWVAGTQLWLATQKQKRVVFRGEGLGQPQALADGSVWNIASVNGHWVLLRIGTDARIATFPLGALPPGQVVSFSLAPDATRVAVAISQGSSMAVGVASLGRGASAAAQGWHPTPVVPSSTPLEVVRSIGWSGPSELTVLGSLRASQPLTVFQVSDDAADVLAVGPASDVQAVDLRVAVARTGSTTLLRTKTGDVLSLGEPWRWFPLAHGVTAVALAG